MKLSTNNTSLDTNINKAADFGIDDNDMSHIMGILRSQIYSDKLLAVIREYSTNAMDANKEAGNTSPINVSLPTSFNPILSFRDYGNGMTDEDVINTYIKYGNSTKRNSNDYTGCLGIGSKAGFAYGDAFTIISYTRRYITTWLARIDESKKGTISITSQVINKSSIKTGTEIQVPILKVDIDNCIQKAKTFFKYWKQKPICNVEFEEVNYLEQTDEYSVLNKSYVYHGKSTVLMGNIIYPINIDQLSGIAKNILSNDTIIANAPLGSLDIAANRETLEYSKRTIDGLTAIAHNIACDLANNLKKSIAHCPSRITASIESCKYNGILKPATNEQIVNKTTWKGLYLLNSIAFNNNAVSHSLQKSWRSGSQHYRNVRNNDVHSTTVNKTTRLCVYDETDIGETNATRRIRTLQDKDSSPDITYFVIQKSKLSLIEPQLTPDDYIDLATIDPMPAKRTIIANPNGTKKKSVRINVCHLAPAHLKSERVSQEKEPIKCETTDKYVYVPLDRFDWKGHADALNELKLIQDAIHHMNNGKFPTINGVKKHYASKLNDEWIPLDQYINNLYKAWAKANKKDNQMAIDVTSIKDWDHWDGTNAMLLMNVKADPRVKYLAQVINNTRNKDQDITKNCRVINVCKLLGLLPKDYAFIKEETKILNAKYPLLRALNANYSHAEDKTIINHINKYIQSVS